MGLESIKMKMEEKQASPYKRRTIIEHPDGSKEVVTESITFEEWLADQEEEYQVNPEDPDYDGW